MLILHDWLWVIFTLSAALAQTLRNATQRSLIAELGAAAAAHVRFLFGLPFGLLFLVVVLLLTGATPPRPSPTALAWMLSGSLMQILGTALMLAAMTERSFVVTIAYTKTEPVQVAVFGIVMLSETLTLPLIAAILIATSGVMIMGWPARQVAGAPHRLKPALLGMAAGGFFAMAAISFRGAILALQHDDYVLAAITTLAIGLVMQTAMLTTWLALRDRAALREIVAAWRPSLGAGFLGAVASAFWYLAFALESAARVRTLALAEILFAQIISRNMFRQKTSPRDAIGIALVVIGVIVLLNV